MTVANLILQGKSQYFKIFFSYLPWKEFFTIIKLPNYLLKKKKEKEAAKHN